MDFEIVADFPCETGEGPLWHPDEKCLYWTDIPNGRLYRYDPASGHAGPCYDGEVVGGITLQEDGSLLLFMGKGAIRTWRSGQIVATLMEEIPEERESRFNDVIADPQGRVFCGTMPTPERQGRLYRLDLNGRTRVILEDIGCSNGMGFGPDGKRLYFIDSPTRNVYLFDYDAASGEITNQRLFVRTPDGKGFPDGMTVDSEGYVWCAKWGGWGVERYTPDGSLDGFYPLPVSDVSSVIFGGEDYTDLYVTTAGGHQRTQEAPLAGALFRLNVKARGVPEFRSRIAL